MGNERKRKQKQQRGGKRRVRNGAARKESEPAVDKTWQGAAKLTFQFDGPATRQASLKPRREQPARLRGEDGAARQKSRRQRATRGQRAQPLQVRARTLWPTPAAATQSLDELHLAFQEVKCTAC